MKQEGRPRDNFLNSGRGSWSSPYRAEKRHRLEDTRLSDFAARLLEWTVNEADDTTGRYEPVTRKDLALHFNKSADTIRSALTQLRKAGYIDFNLPGARREGWIEVVRYYGQVMYPTERLRRRWRGSRWAENVSDVASEDEASNAG